MELATLAEKKSPPVCPPSECPSRREAEIPDPVGE
jgi:hypothetical protein